MCNLSWTDYAHDNYTAVINADVFFWHYFCNGTYETWYLIPRMTKLQHYEFKKKTKNTVQSLLRSKKRFFYKNSASQGACGASIARVTGCAPSSGIQVDESHANARVNKTKTSSLHIYRRFRTSSDDLDGIML